MVKQVQKIPNNNRQIQAKANNKENEPIKAQSISKEHKYLKFVSFLKHLHKRIGKQTIESANNQMELREIMEELMHFFNKTRKYSQNELDLSIICLANLLAFIRHDVNNLEFQKEFKNKLKNFFPTLNRQHEHCSENHESKITAVFYILAVLIYKQHLTLSNKIIELNKTIYSDSTIIKSLLSITIFPEARLSKFYGIVLQYLSNKIFRKKQKQILLKSIILNFKNIKNQSTLINLLIYLRLQKNKIKITFDDIVQGEIIELLMKLYPKYIDKHQSTYILDYIHYLVTLFPELSYKVINHDFLNFLIENTHSQTYHSLQEIPLLNLIHFSLEIPSKIDKATFLNFCMDFLLIKSSFSFKLLEIIIQYQINMEKLLIWFEKEGFVGLLETMKRQNDDNSIVKVIKVCLKVIKKIQTWNEAMATYLNFHLSQKFKILENRRINGKQLIELFRNTHHQY